MTQLAGRVGGQYHLLLTENNQYRVSGLLFGQLKTIWTGDYEAATKLMSYCVIHDGEAQTALSHLYVEGDPTLLSQLLENARNSTEARARRRVGVIVEIISDVLEGENAVQIVTERLAQACQLTGCRVMLIQGSYIDMDEQTRLTDMGRIARQRDFLLDHMIESQDGIFSFPDGETFPCRKLSQRPKEDRPDISLGTRSAASQPEIEKINTDA